MNSAPAPCASAALIRSTSRSSRWAWRDHIGPMTRQARCMASTYARTPRVGVHLVAAAVDEVGAEDPAAVADEGVRAVPLVHAEVAVEAVGDRVPRDVLPSHAGLHALKVRLRRARGVDERGVAGVEMRQVRDVVGPERAADAAVLGPAGHA